MRRKKCAELDQNERCHDKIPSCATSWAEDKSRTLQKTPSASSPIKCSCGMVNLIECGRITNYKLRFTIYDLRFTIYDLRFTIYDLRFTIYDLRFTIYDLRFTIYDLRFTNFDQVKAGSIHT
jgi:hypothetical protein